MADDKEQREENRQQQDKRGRTAQNPWRLHWRGWKEALVRAYQQIGKDNILIVGAGVAFYAFTSLFPLMVGIISTYGLVASPAQATEQMAAVADALPHEAHTLLNEQIQRLTTQTKDKLGWGVALGILFALWSASSAVKAMMTALNIVYNEPEKRAFIRQALTCLLLTFAITLAVVIALGFIVVAPPILNELPIGAFGKKLVGFSRWPVLLFLALFIIGLLYRWGPSRAKARVSWLNPGAVFAAFAWIFASWGFSLFVSRFKDFGETYGSLTAVIILLLWFMLSSTVVLMGAEINSELERQTKKDSTTGEPRPMGERGAYAADTLGGRRHEEEP